jgi:hypothetical protein
MIIAADFETRRIYDTHLRATDILRTWEEQDGIYPDQAREHGAGYHSEKFVSPHMCGRAIDLVPALDPQTGEDRHKLEKVYSHVVSYFNSRFPYCWNAPFRLLKNGKLVPSSFKTAVDHTTKGRHIHVQLSWGSFIE